jgi:pSer/pThr/pTyr-binding forkhead associated (FHA) protein
MTALSKSLAELMTESVGLSDEDFRKKYPDPALVVLGNRLALPARSNSQTVKIDLALIQVEDFVAYRTSPSENTGARERPTDVLGAFGLESTVYWVVKGEGNRHPFKFFAVGRATNNDLVLPQGSVSKVHVLIQLDEHDPKVSDARSTNGTWLNGERVGSVPMPLRPGDYLCVGDDVRMLYVDPPALRSLLRRHSPRPA